MTEQELYIWCLGELRENVILSFPEDIFTELDKSKADVIAKAFGDHALMRLPERDIKFFDWLRINDEKVWLDLWGKDELNNDPYIVSVSLLPLLIDDTRGFPICDLLENDNYYFTEEHINSDDAKLFIESSKERVLAKNPLTVAQLLALEISFAPIDVWRFAYKNEISLESAFRAVQSLKNDGLLIHLTDAAYLAPFVKF
ncbi:MAG: hypothetical protein WCT77_06075 [Bacteroidota bacterium]|jgi:hypothetical protein